MFYYYNIIIITFIALSIVCPDRVMKITHSITLWSQFYLFRFVLLNTLGDFDLPCVG
jgi:hypothetical protein